MANVRKTYFLCPSFDYPPPPAGPIQLGSILSSPFLLDRALNSKDTIVPVPPGAIFTTTKSEWKSTLSNGNFGSVGLFAKFLQFVVGIGAEANVEWEKANLSEASVKRLETCYFNPTEVEGYLESALKTPKVRHFIEKSRVRKPVYMVTGLKIARGGRINTREAIAQGMTLGLSLDGIALAAPIEVGPQMEIRTKKTESTSWEGSDDFIFGYRLSKMKLRKKTEEVKVSEHIKGALYELDLQASDQRDVGYELENIAGDDFAEIEAFGDNISDVSDEKEDCRCVVPQRNLSFSGST
jgi:hypothetical protein